MKPLKNHFIPLSIAIGLALVLSQPTTAGSGASNERADTVQTVIESAEHRDSPAYRIHIDAD